MSKFKFLNQNYRNTGKQSIGGSIGGGGSNPKLQTTQQLLAAEQSSAALNSSKGKQTVNSGSYNGLITLGNLTGPGGGAPGGNRPGINSSGATTKKNGSMGLGGGMGSFQNYEQKHIASQVNYSYNPQSAISGIAGISTGAGSVSNFNGGYNYTQSISAKAAYGQSPSGGQINKLSPTGSRLSHGGSQSLAKQL